MVHRLVLDSSVIVKLLNAVDEQYLDNADTILTQAIKGKVMILTPELAKYEIGNVLLLKKKLSLKQIEFPLHALYSYPIEFIPETLDLAKETFKLATNLKITYYDASFISLAKQYDAHLVTDKIKHQGKTKEVKVVSLAEYSA